MSTTPNPYNSDVPEGVEVPAPRVAETGTPESPLPGTGTAESTLPGTGSPLDVDPGPEQPVTEQPVTEQPVAEPAAGTPGAKAHREADLRPLYAVAGLTDLVVGAVRSTLADAEHWASARLQEMRFRQAELEKQAAQLRERAEDVPDQVRTLPDVTRSRVSELQQQASSTYAELAGRGQRVVHDVVDRIDPVFDRVQESVGAARRRVTGHSAGVAPTPGPNDIIVVNDTFDAHDDPASTPSGVPDEALVAEDTILSEGDASRTDDDDMTGTTTRDDDGDATSER